MKVANPTGKTLEELLDKLSLHYPGAKIRKPFLGIGPKNLILPSGNMKHVVRTAKNNLVTDFVPPVALIVLAVVLGIVLAFVGAFIVYSMGGRYTIGGVLWMLLVLLLLKYFYKNSNKEKFEKFHTDLNLALTSSSQPGSIF